MLNHKQSVSAMPCSENTTPSQPRTVYTSHAPFDSGPMIPWPYLEISSPIAPAI